MAVYSKQTNENLSISVIRIWIPPSFDCVQPANSFSAVYKISDRTLEYFYTHLLSTDNMRESSRHLLQPIVWYANQRRTNKRVDQYWTHWREAITHLPDRMTPQNKSTRTAKKKTKLQICWLVNWSYASMREICAR